MSKKVAVIGAGACGLTAIKCCLDEGLEPICFERTDDLGGLWRFTPYSKEGQACVMKSTVINTSKEMMSYSDFPIPKDFPPFMHNTKVVEYFHMYADQFGLKQYIKYKTEVARLYQATDYEETGRWNLAIRDLNKDDDSSTTTITVDSVLICTGHHATPHIPKWPGQEEFTGQMVHTHDYKDHKGYEDKRVVVVGIGNSGGDVSVELSRVAKQVFLSTRRGAWVLNRVFAEGLPIDIVNTTRFTHAMSSLSPSMSEAYVHNMLNKRFDHENYGLKPKHGFLAQHPTVNDDLPNRLICGSIIVKPDVKRLTKTGVEFVDGSIEDDIDAVIVATGYIFGFPFIDKKVLDVKDNEVNLYEYMFPPELKHGTLAVIGCFQPFGAIMPLAEMQCRWAARIFKGSATLPKKDVMWQNIMDKKDAMAKQFVKSQRHTIQVNYVHFMNELSVLVGCHPNFWKLWFTDPKLASACYFGPCTPYQYRLHGPGTWKGAKAAIEGQMERTIYPLRKKDLPKKSSSIPIFFKFCIFLALVVAVYCKFIDKLFQ